MDHHYRRKKMGGMAKNGGMGGDMAKKMFLEPHYFLRLQKPYSRKLEGGTCPAPCPLHKKFFKKSYNICISSCKQNIKLDQFSQQNTHCRKAILQNSSLGAPNVWKAGLCATTGLEGTGLKWARPVGLINNFYI